MTNNLWKGFSFKENRQKSALDYLNELKPGLIEETGGELLLDTESADAYIDGEPPRPAAVYKLFVVAPNLGHFRRKILTVAEYSDQGRFPVDVVNHFNSDMKISDISEDQFIKQISEILLSPIVKNSIENLFQQSKQNNKK